MALIAKVKVPTAEEKFIEEIRLITPQVQVKINQYNLDDGSEQWAICFTYPRAIDFYGRDKLLVELSKQTLLPLMRPLKPVGMFDQTTQEGGGTTIKVYVSYRFASD